MKEFRNLEDLYNHLKPALSSKLRELKNMGYNYIQLEDIWNYLIASKWSKCSELTLYEVVDDIFNLDNDVINNYVLEILNKNKRKVEEMDVL